MPPKVDPVLSKSDSDQSDEGDDLPPIIKLFKKDDYAALGMVKVDVKPTKRPDVGSGGNNTNWKGVVTWTGNAFDLDDKVTTKKIVQSDTIRVSVYAHNNDANPSDHGITWVIGGLSVTLKNAIARCFSMAKYNVNLQERNIEPSDEVWWANINEIVTREAAKKWKESRPKKNDANPKTRYTFDPEVDSRVSFAIRDKVTGEVTYPRVMLANVLKKSAPNALKGECDIRICIKAKQPAGFADHTTTTPPENTQWTIGIECVNMVFTNVHSPGYTKCKYIKSGSGSGGLAARPPSVRTSNAASGDALQLLMDIMSI